jgi:elongation factor P
MAMLSHVDLRKGVKIEIDGTPWLIIGADFVKPGKGSAFTRVRIRSFLTGNTIERTFKASDKVVKADVEQNSCQYLYREGDDFHFMDSTTFDQIMIPKENMGDTWKWMEENMEALVLFWRGRAISCEVPNYVALEITRCEPGIKGDTAQGATKPATLSTGATVNVPLFVNEGEWVRVDTRTGKYTERVKAP